jgi:hypothetical protein
MLPTLTIVTSVLTQKVQREFERMGVEIVVLLILWTSNPKYSMIVHLNFLPMN